MVNSALKTFENYPAKNRHPLEGFDNEVLRHLRKWSVRPPSGGKVYAVFEAGTPLLRDGMNPTANAKLFYALRRFRDRFWGAIPPGEFCGEFGFFVTPAGIDRTKFEYCGRLFVRTDNGIPLLIG